MTGRSASISRSLHMAVACVAVAAIVFLTMNNYLSLEAVGQLAELHPPNLTSKSAISPDHKE